MYQLRSSRVLKETQNEKIEKPTLQGAGLKPIQKDIQSKNPELVSQTIQMTKDLYDTPILFPNQSIKKRTSLVPKQSPGMDLKDIDDAQAVAEYAKAIFEHFRANESKYLPNPTFMMKQEELRSNHRQTLFDWIIDIHLKFKMLPETLFLTVNIIDRFISIENVTKKKFQLVGVTAMMIAGKYEEIYPPKLHQYVKICANAYSEDDIKEMETVILDNLKWNITVATSESFLGRYLKTCRADSKICHMSNFFTEIAAFQDDTYKFLPSLIACSSILLSKKLLSHQEVWDTTAEYYTLYKASDLEDCMDWLFAKTEDYLKEANLTAIRRKYDSKKYWDTWNCVQGLICLLKSNTKL